MPEIFQSNVEVGFASLSVFRLVMLPITALIVAATAWLFYRPRFGMQVRAVMQNKEMVASFGVNADRVYMTTFALGAGLAGVWPARCSACS
ncbi:MAG: hypothetical protein PGN25_08680 [Methylorubrum populi]